MWEWTGSQFEGAIICGESSHPEQTVAGCIAYSIMKKTLDEQPAYIFLWGSETVLPSFRADLLVLSIKGKLSKVLMEVIPWLVGDSWFCQQTTLTITSLLFKTLLFVSTSVAFVVVLRRLQLLFRCYFFFSFLIVVSEILACKTFDETWCFGC